MIIEFVKRKDGNTVLRCVRDDGSIAWQRNNEELARFFPLHDLTHYAVETELGFRHGFYGLIAEGWDIAETTGKTARGALPNQALEVEYLVSAFSGERASGDAATADEFNQLAANFASANEMTRPRELTDQDLARVRSRIDHLFLQWRTLPAGQTLALVFPLL